MSFYQVLRRDEMNFFQALPGGSDHTQLYKAIHSAQSYHEVTGAETQVVNQQSVVVWSSTTDMHVSKP